MSDKKDKAFVPFRPKLALLFQRIGLNEEDFKHPTLSALRTLHYRFLLTFPFENLLMHGYNPSGDLKYPVKIEPAVIEEKLLNHQRGGYCFELNQYFYLVLKELGFNVMTKTARVLYGFTNGEFSSRTHLISILRFEDGQRFLCDVAFGAGNPVLPLRIEVGVHQTTVYNTHRIIPYSESAPHHLKLQFLKDQCDHSESGSWTDLYFFDEEEMSTPVDWDLGNWSICTHPNSLFVNSILMSKLDINGRYSLFNNRFSFRRLDFLEEQSNILTIEQVQTMSVPTIVTDAEITSKEEFSMILREKFKMNIPKEFEVTIKIPETTW